MNAIAAKRRRHTMKRRTMLATAAATALVLLAGTAAAATNLGLLGSADDTGAVGGLTPQEATVDDADAPDLEPAAQARTTTERRARILDDAPEPTADRPYHCLDEDAHDDDRSSFDCLYDRDRDRDQDHDRERRHDGWEDDD
jgi:hypothetical protein